MSHHLFLSRVDFLFILKPRPCIDYGRVKFSGVKVWTLWWSSMCGNDASCSELPSGSLSPMNLGIVILEHVHAIGEGKKIC